MDGLADTCFLIALARRDVAAEIWLIGRPAFGLALCDIVYAELRSGVDSPIELEAMLRGFPVVSFDREVAELWGTLRRVLRTRGFQIGQNDLWIACTALRHGLPVVTRNVREFSRVPGLTVLAY